jgi:hypothetical protein
MTTPQAANEDSVRALFSASYENALNNYKGTCYTFGAKAGGEGGIDCSGFVYKGLADAFGDLRKNEGTQIRSGIFNTSSEQQFEAIAKGSGAALEGSGRDFRDGGSFAGQIREGMIIARSSGKDQGWNTGRALGIDHIVCVYKDSRTGELMVAESSGRTSAETNSDGVQRTKLSEWLERNRNQHLYVADPVKMAMNNLSSGDLNLISANPGQTVPSGRNDGTAIPAGGGIDTQDSSKPSFNKSSAGMWGFLALLLAAAYVARKDDTPGPNTPRALPTPAPAQ